jgi:bifunctional DNase/RNase
MLLAAVMAACSCTRSSLIHSDKSSAAGSNEVRVQVANVGFDEATGAHYVLLRGGTDSHELPIMIGDNEAQAIVLALHGVKPERPLTHDLLKSVIEKTGNHVDRIVIAEMRNEVYYAKIFLDHGRYSIDCRPSDAIALAMGTSAPIFVNDRLFAHASIPGEALSSQSGKLPPTTHALGLTVEQLTPELASYFGTSSEHGVLVSAVDPIASRAGVARGDIVVKIGNRDINALEDFSHTALGVRNGSVMLTLSRDGASRTVMLENLVTPEPRH